MQVQNSFYVYSLEILSLGPVTLLHFRRPFSHYLSVCRGGSKGGGRWGYSPPWPIFSFFRRNEKINEGGSAK